MRKLLRKLGVWLRCRNGHHDWIEERHELKRSEELRPYQIAALQMIAFSSKNITLRVDRMTGSAYHLTATCRNCEARERR